MATIFLLIKVFDKEEYADAFIQTGEMFCKTIGQFKRIEGDVARGDKFEALSDWHQPDRVSLTLSFKSPNGEEKSFPIGLAGPLAIQSNAHDHLNAFCMYAVSVPDFEGSYETEEERLHLVKKFNSMLKVSATLGDEMLALGEHAVLIYNVAEFIDRVIKAAKSEGYSSWKGLVEYFDPDIFHGSFEGVESVFRKRSVYSYQREFRFVFTSDRPDGEKTLHAGPLEGMALKLKTGEINGKLELKLAEG
ncbi:hypothetical protein [Rhodoferax sp. GW822-FHT02A01]|uniref:hypothetical protein n=1 Tax=Rhodoferax sp. GW822-FHT02A01 TaxID=3141537 RepID=UPI00315CC154